MNAWMAGVERRLEQAEGNLRRLAEHLGLVGLPVAHNPAVRAVLEGEGLATSPTPPPASPPVVRDGQFISTHPTLGEVAVGKPSAYADGPPVSPPPAPHPLAGLEFRWTDSDVWRRPDKYTVVEWLDPVEQDEPCDYTGAFWRDSTTHAPVPLWQVAKRLGVEHPVPAEVRWTDVEYQNKEPRGTSADTWRLCHNTCGKRLWGTESDRIEFAFRLTAAYDHQPITYAQFREILAREDKVDQVEVTDVDHATRSITLTVTPAMATDNPLYQIGDKVRVTRGKHKGQTARVDRSQWDLTHKKGSVRLLLDDGVLLGWHDYDEVELVRRDHHPLAFDCEADRPEQVASVSPLYHVVESVKRTNGFACLTPEAKGLVKELAEMWERA